MVNPMLLQIKTQLAKNQKEYNEYKTKAVRCFYELQNHVNPYFGDDIENIKAEEIEQIGDELLIVKKKLFELHQSIKKIKNELGED